MVNDKPPLGRDAEQLKALGYVSHFDRTMSKWENFSLGFTYFSPVVGLYTIFATAFPAGDPPMWWTYILVGALVVGGYLLLFALPAGRSLVRALRHARDDGRRDPDRAHLHDARAPYERGTAPAGDAHQLGIGASGRVVTPIDA